MRAVYAPYRKKKYLTEVRDSHLHRLAQNHAYNISIYTHTYIMRYIELLARHQREPHWLEKKWAD